jgi:hypothetical protein
MSVPFNPELMKALDATHIGTIGEYFVASVLGGYGYEVIHAAGKGYDLLVMDVDHADHPIRVDVKTKSHDDGHRVFSIKKGKTTTFRGYESKSCDLFALLCLEDMSLSFDLCEDFDGKGSLYLNREVHRGTDPYDSWRGAVQRLPSRNSTASQSGRHIAA